MNKGLDALLAPNTIFSAGLVRFLGLVRVSFVGDPEHDSFLSFGLASRLFVSFPKGHWILAYLADLGSRQLIYLRFLESSKGLFSMI